MWDTARIRDHLAKHRDMYKYIHDQTLRLANQGLTMHEIADTLQLPKCLSREFYNREYVLMEQVAWA
jgi:alkyl sulfatase BDS1-like metallo-beta-lactamase superfamily hydrolase